MKAILIPQPGKATFGNITPQLYAEPLGPNEIRLPPTETFTVTHTRLYLPQAAKKTIINHFKQMRKNIATARRLKAITKGRHWHHVPGTIAPNFYHFKY